MTVHELIERTKGEELEKLTDGKKFDITVYEELKNMEKILIIASAYEKDLSIKTLLDGREIIIRALLFTYTRYRD
jgi:hypothetical protein